MNHRTVLVVLGVMCLTAGSGTAWGATIHVKTMAIADARGGACDLIQAIENANADAAIHSGCEAGTGPDVIELERVTEYVLEHFHSYDNGQNGLPTIVGDLVINGNGSVVRRANGVEPFRIFYVSEGSRLVLNDLGIQNGRLEGPLRGGGIYNFGGEVFLNNCAVTGNRVELQCGGILNQSGVMTLMDSRVNNNAADRDGGGVCNWFGNLMVFHSEVNGNSSSGDAGGIFNLGRANGHGSVFLKDTDVTNNRAAGVGAGLHQRPVGASSHAAVSLTVVDSTISENVAQSGAGGLDIAGSMQNLITSRVDVRNSTISDNQGRWGAGIFAWYGTDLSVTGTMITNNRAVDASGGGIFVGHHSTLLLARSTLAGNSADGLDEFEGYGGGLAVTDSTAEIRLSTFSGNRAMTRDGAALWVSSGVGSNGLDVSVKIRGSTIYRNTAQRVGAGIKADRYYGDAAVEVSVLNTILAENSVPLRVDSLVDYGNCLFANGAEIASEGYNVADGGVCGFSAATDRVVDDVMLFDLEDNGGPTLTHMPRSGSPVLDTGGSDGEVTCTDQRGYPRHADGDHDGVCLCDTGAVESQSVPMSSPHDGTFGGPEVPGLDN